MNYRGGTENIEIHREIIKFKIDLSPCFSMPSVSLWFVIYFSFTYFFFLSSNK